MLTLSNTTTSDLTEESLIALLEQCKREVFVHRASQVAISPEVLAFTREKAKEDPEFARRMKAYWPELAKSLLADAYPED